MHASNALLINLTVLEIANFSLVSRAARGDDQIRGALASQIRHAVERPTRSRLDREGEQHQGGGVTT